MFSFLLALQLLWGGNAWVASRDAALSGWLTDLASGLHPAALGQMDLFEAGSIGSSSPGPLNDTDDGVVRRRRLALAVQGNPENDASPWRFGAAALWERGGWNHRLSLKGLTHDFSGNSWGGGLLLAGRPSLQLGGGLLHRDAIASDSVRLAGARNLGWGLARLGRLSFVGEHTGDDIAMAELAWQVEPVYNSSTEGLFLREFSLGARYIDGADNAWDSRHEFQFFTAVPVWLDQMRLLAQAGTSGGFERATLQCDLLPQGLVGIDLSYAGSRYAGRRWGFRARFTAISLGWNDPEDVRDLGPAGGDPVLSLRLRMTFDAADTYYSPGRHAGPLEKISETTHAR